MLYNIILNLLTKYIPFTLYVTTIVPTLWDEKKQINVPSHNICVLGNHRIPKYTMISKNIENHQAKDKLQWIAVWQLLYH